jgi:hypothetical protein
LSRDAGLSWTKIRDGTSIYEFADHGAIITFAENSQATSTISYTKDEGLNIIECTFTNNPVEITSIRLYL